MYYKYLSNLPKPVYYQCVWLVKDIDRLQNLAAIRRQGISSEDVICFEDEELTVINEAVLIQAEHKLACIKGALDELPEEYKYDMIDSMVYGYLPVEKAHENTWRKWRRFFIKELAFRLNLI